NQGMRLNFWFQNTQNTPAIVRIERRSGANWVQVHSMTVPAHSQGTRQIPHITLNTEHRATVSNSSGAPVSGLISVRQTSDPL
ncbi:MAG: hypothetical protein FWF57_05590, partial [Defluviitaleaceae bacterium]|nr:hypothetical protein [Defluviitaleaceae bacterium]